MSEIRAQLYDGNPMSITEEELTRLYQQPQFGMELRMEATTTRGKGRDSKWRVYVPAMRASGERGPHE